MLTIKYGRLLFFSKGEGVARKLSWLERVKDKAI